MTKVVIKKTTIKGCPKMFWTIALLAWNMEHVYRKKTGDDFAKGLLNSLKSSMKKMKTKIQKQNLEVNQQQKHLTFLSSFLNS